ncbi:cell division protein FtsK (plasmid) [Actinomadura sp. ATCC 31491]|uniref:Cell division protein FtsK n=1 Tax=Actinomadura luzonensis TaxID=2805427 RepID=A0ABT0FSE5_9ACTN|nr:FtsK/SpoIIIE domain-containing protein [Actinomadura luzonensis]MCK2215245.1 cell division protein FtsK [Actinomadura luzonensis]MCK2222027.1 cell division protein FtsK [Actinomadura luzonensis]
MLRKLPGDEVQNVVSTRPDTSIHYRPVVVRTPGIVFLAVHLSRMVAALVKTVWRHPVACTLLAAAGALVYFFGWRVWVSVAGLEIAALASWFALSRSSFEACVALPALTWCRWMWVYRRKWAGIMAVAGLGRSLGGRSYLPDLVKVTCDRYADRVTVRMLSGQDPDEWAVSTAGLAHGFGADRCRVKVLKPGRLLLTFPRKDALAKVLPPQPIPDRPHVHAVFAGLTEDGRLFRMRVHGTHLLIAGATGSGKGSYLWAAVRGLLPATQAGLAELWGLDPKRMELAYGRALFQRYAATAEECAVLLEKAVEVMHERASRYGGVRRDHDPTTQDPFILVIVDEVAFLTAYQPDKGLKVRVMAALSTLTTQGRAVGVAVMAALQDPRKDVMSIRNLFPDRIALRLDEAEQVDMVLGDGARDRGALCDQIPFDPDDPSVGAGVAYVRLENSPEPIRVRAGYTSNDEIKRMVMQYTAAGEVA